jgi:ribosomal protein L29
MRTLAELGARAERAIQKREQFVLEMSAEYGQIFDNVKHMFWFRRAVAKWLTEHTKQWSHLATHFK